MEEDEAMGRWRPRWRPAAALAACVVAAAAIAACGSNDQSENAAAGGTSGGTRTVSIGAVPSLLYLPVYVADAQGYFAKQGLKMDYKTLPDTAPALLSGDIDFSLNGADGAFIAASQGKPTPIVAILQQRNSLSLYATTKTMKKVTNSSYPQSIQSLKGAKWGTTARVGGGEVFMQAVFQGAGLKEGSGFSIVALGQASNILAALKAGRVDGALLFPPFSAQAEVEGFAKPVVQEAKGEGPSELSQSYGAALLASPKAVGDSALLKKMTAAIQQGQEYTRDSANKANLVQIAKKYTGITDEKALGVALDSVASLSKPSFDCSRADTQAKLLLKVGTIKKPVTCDDVAVKQYLPAP
jgi:NitT/TauT family transport system substrate-binding protein